MWRCGVPSSGVGPQPPPVSARERARCADMVIPASRDGSCRQSTIVGRTPRACCQLQWRCGRIAVAAVARDHGVASDVCNLSVGHPSFGTFSGQGSVWVMGSVRCFGECPWERPPSLGPEQCWSWPPGPPYSRIVLTPRSPHDDAHSYTSSQSALHSYDYCAPRFLSSATVQTSKRDVLVIILPPFGSERHKMSACCREGAWETFMWRSLSARRASGL